MSFAFLLTSLIVVASPGTGVLYTLATALTRGSRASVAAAFGCTLGILPAMLAAMLGLAAVLHTSALAFAAIGAVASQMSMICAAVLRVELSSQAIRATSQHGALSVETRLDARSSRRVIVTGFLINILNPKLSIFFLAFLPQFIAADEPHPVGRMLELSATFMAMTFGVFVIYGLFAATVRDRVVSRPRVMTWLRRAFAGGFALLGAKLAFAER